MTGKQIITVGIEPSLLKRVRAIAARRGRSISELLTDKLRVLVAEECTYQAAHRTAKAMWTSGLDLRGDA